MILKTLWQFQYSLQWHHNGCDGISNHQPHNCLLDCIFKSRSKKTSKLRVTGLCVGNSPVTSEFPHKGPVTRKMFTFDDVIMLEQTSLFLPYLRHATLWCPKIQVWSYIVTLKWGMSPVRHFWNCHPDILYSYSSQCNLFGDWVSVDFISGHLVFRCIAMTFESDRVFS